MILEANIRLPLKNFFDRKDAPVINCQKNTFSGYLTASKSSTINSGSAKKLMVLFVAVTKPPLKG